MPQGQGQGLEIGPRGPGQGLAFPVKPEAKNGQDNDSVAESIADDGH